MCYVVYTVHCTLYSLQYTLYCNVIDFSFFGELQCYFVLNSSDRLKTIYLIFSYAFFSNVSHRHLFRLKS